MDMPLPLVFAVQQGIATVLKLDPQTASSLDAINGKVIRVNVTSPQMCFHLIVVDQSIEVEGAFDAEPDTIVTGSAVSLLSLRTKTDALYTGDVTITGDVQTGEQLRGIISGLDISISDTIAPITGDTIAHQVGQSVSQLTAWLSDTGTRLQKNTSEYLQEEVELLAPNSEINRFCAEVDELREQGDRLHARLHLLEQAKKSND